MSTTHAPALDLPAGLVRGWERLTQNPTAPVAWTAAVGGAVLVWWQGYLQPLEVSRWTRPLVDAPTVDWFTSVFSYDLYVLSTVWSFAALLSGILAVALAPARTWPAVILAALPFAAVPFLGLHTPSWTLVLAVVTAIIALRDPLAALVPATLTLGALWVVHPFFFSYDYAGTPTTGRTPALLIYTGVVVLGYLAAAGFGAWLRSRVDVREAHVVHDRAVAAESQAAERARISRDLHDVVAHHVSLVAVRAESAPYQHPDLDSTARTVLAEIAGDARAALGELRHVLAVLQRTVQPELAPQPSVEDVDELIAVARAAGQEVALVGDWPVATVPASTGYVLYRAAQEALTNARRHSPGAAVRVVRGGDEDEVVLRIVSTGPHAPAGSGTDADAAGDAPVREGRGLIGMRERVETVGGTLDVRVSGGTFTVVVTLPLSDASGTGGHDD